MMKEKTRKWFYISVDRYDAETTEENWDDKADIACELADYANRFCSSFDDEWN